MERKNKIIILGLVCLLVASVMLMSDVNYDEEQSEANFGDRFREEKVKDFISSLQQSVPVRRLRGGGE